MNDYKNIVNCLGSQYDYLRMCNMFPERVILGIKIVEILDAYCKDHIFEYKVYDGKFFFMNLPVTVDYKDKWIMMVCAGKEWDGRNFLNI